jgi:hypothetical protein
LLHKYSFILQAEDALSRKTLAAVRLCRGRKDETRVLFTRQEHRHCQVAESFSMAAGAENNISSNCFFAAYAFWRILAQPKSFRLQ